MSQSSFGVGNCVDDDVPGLVLMLPRRVFDSGVTPLATRTQSSLRIGVVVWVCNALATVSIVLSVCYGHLP